MIWEFSFGTVHEEFPTKKLALAWTKAAGWQRWAGKGELIVFVRGTQAAGLRKIRKPSTASVEAL